MNVERFLIQVKQNLPEHEGVTTWVEDSALNVGYGKSESFEIRYPGGICYNAATEKTDEFYKLVEEADKAFKTVKEYIDLMDNAPELSARDFNMPYKLLAEFNGVVLGGIEHRSNNTFEFTTWSYANNSLYHGHYFTDYEKAKEDFAVRSGLLQATKLFTDKEMMQIYVLLLISPEVQLNVRLLTLKKQVLLRRKEGSETMAVAQAITMCLQTKNFYNL